MWRNITDGKALTDLYRRGLRVDKERKRVKMTYL